MKLPLRVDRNIPLKDFLKVTGGTLKGEHNIEISGVSLDSRSIKKGDLFFAIHGSRDGHDFVADALAKGASGAVVGRELETHGALIKVSDPKQALWDYANSVRCSWGKLVVAISGSNGKTTTKETVAAILSQHRNILKAPGTWNNELGVPLTLLMLQKNHEVAVLELGVSDFGEMTQLCKITDPNVALLTNIGPSHLEKLGSLDGVAKAKGELFKAMKKEDVIIVNLDDHLIREIVASFSARQITISRLENADVSISSRKISDSGEMHLEVKYGKEEIALHSPLVGDHNVSNLLCALGIALHFKVPAKKLQKGIDAIEVPEMRMEILECPDKIRIANDCYNANPASMLAALEVMEELHAARKIALVGDMMELGDYSARAHRDIGIHVAQLEFHHLFAVGQFSGDYAQGAIQGGMEESQITRSEKLSEMKGLIMNYLQEGDLLLIKGSRGMQLEQITEYLCKSLRGGSV